LHNQGVFVGEKQPKLIDVKLIQFVYIFLFSLLVPDLRPNVGLFWYFFTEMFEHFRPLFVCAFQINCFLYVAPLALRLRKEPMLLAFSLAALSTVFRSYPSVGDLGFYLGMLPIWLHLLPCNYQNFHIGLLMKFIISSRYAAGIRRVLLLHFFECPWTGCVAVVDLHAVWQCKLLLWSHVGIRNCSSNYLNSNASLLNLINICTF
jgi:hypothetical protein